MWYAYVLSSKFCFIKSLHEEDVESFIFQCCISEHKDFDDFFEGQISVKCWIEVMRRFKPCRAYCVYRRVFKFEGTANSVSSSERKDAFCYVDTIGSGSRHYILFGDNHMETRMFLSSKDIIDVATGENYKKDYIVSGEASGEGIELVVNQNPLIVM